MPLRADEALVQASLCEDVRRAQALIMEGKALYGSEKILKPSELIKNPELLRIKGASMEYVSRGAYKLKRAFEVFDISAAGKVCMDVGASTGGFSNILLHENAKRVYCIDVGYNLLDWKIRSDARVTVMEKTNARFLTPSMFDEQPDFGATDVSFISLKAILPAVFSVLKPNSDFIALVKPQFEAAKEEVGEKGVVRDQSVHRKVLGEICLFAGEQGLSVCGADFSPIRGPEGNIEFLLHLKNDAQHQSIGDVELDEVVCSAHERFS